jgi:hypothetical protein
MKHSIHLLAPAAALLAGLACPTAQAARLLAVAPDIDEGCCVRKLATLAETDDGRHVIQARHVASAFLKGPQPGDRVGSEISFELAAIDGIDAEAIWGNGNLGVWGNGNIGYVADLMISVAIKPGSLLALTPSGHVIELRGVWGNGNIGLPQPDDVITHGPFWDAKACGAATSFAEGFNGFFDPLEGAQDPLTGFFDPLEGFDNPIIAIGTENGCVGFVQLAEPAQREASPLELTSGPLVQVAAGAPIESLRLVPMGVEWVFNHEEQIPQSNSWIAPEDNWFPDVNDWMPTPTDWVPNVTQWYEFAALAGGQLHGVYPGARSSAERIGQPPYASFALDLGGLGAAPVDLGSARGGFAPVDDGSAFPLLLADGSTRLTRTSLGAGLLRGEPVELQALGELDLGIAVRKIEVGSLWAVSADGGSLLFAPDFDPARGALGAIYRVGGVHAVDLEPGGFNRDAKGRWITARIEAGGADADGIDPGSVRLSLGDGEPLAPLRSERDDADADGNAELVLKFDRQAVAARLADAERGARVPWRMHWDFADICGDDGAACTGSATGSLRVVQ